MTPQEFCHPKRNDLLTSPPMFAFFAFDFWHLHISLAIQINYPNNKGRNIKGKVLNKCSFTQFIDHD